MSELRLKEKTLNEMEGLDEESIDAEECLCVRNSGCMWNEWRRIDGEV